MCTENTAQGVCQEANTEWGKVKCCIFPHLSAVFFMHTSKGGTLSDLLYSLVFFSRIDFLRTQTAVIFSVQAVSKCSYIQFLVVETIF